MGDDRTEKVLCDACRQETNHEVLYGHKESDTNEDGPWECEHMLVRCRGCGSTRYLRRYGGPLPGGDWGTDEYVYPPYPSGRTPMARVQYVPHHVWLAYGECIRCRVEGLNIVAGIAIRGVIEAVFNEQGAQGEYGLDKKTKWMVANGKLSAARGAVVDELRGFGNRAAHEVSPADPEQVDAALDILENVLDAVYVLPHKGRVLKGKLPTSP